MAENKKVDKEKYLDEIEDSIRTIGILTSGGDAPGTESIALSLSAQTE